MVVASLCDPLAEKMRVCTIIIYGCLIPHNVSHFKTSQTEMGWASSARDPYIPRRDKAFYVTIFVRVQIVILKCSLIETLEFYSCSQIFRSCIYVWSLDIRKTSRFNRIKVERCILLF